MSEFTAEGRTPGDDQATATPPMGQTAAQEMSFAAQSVRSEGQARQIELSNEARLARARGQQGLLTGAFSAAGSLLSGAPKIWPEFGA